MHNLYKWFQELFLLKDKNDSYVGLTHLRSLEKKAKPKPTAKKYQHPKDIKISDLMRGEGQSSV